MKKLKNLYLKSEQPILFSIVIIYLTILIFVFNNIIITEWKELIWFGQFIGFGLLLALRGKQKGWKWY